MATPSQVQLITPMSPALNVGASLNSIKPPHIHMQDSPPQAIPQPMSSPPTYNLLPTASPSTSETEQNSIPIVINELTPQKAPSSLTADVNAARALVFTNVGDDIEKEVNIMLGNPAKRAYVEAKLCRELDNELTTLCCYESYGSVLGLDPLDPKAKDFVWKAVNELRTRLPFLFKLLSILTESSRREISPGPMFTIYSIILRTRSQKFNLAQRYLTSSCLRYRAKNKVIKCFISVHPLESPFHVYVSLLQCF